MKSFTKTALALFAAAFAWPVIAAEVTPASAQDTSQLAVGTECEIDAFGYRWPEVANVGGADIHDFMGADFRHEVDSQV